MYNLGSWTYCWMSIYDSYLLSILKAKIVCIEEEANKLRQRSIYQYLSKEEHNKHAIWVTVNLQI
jgi:hypothetical protein